MDNSMIDGFSCLIIGIFVIVIWYFIIKWFTSVKREGLENSSDSSTADGIAGNAANYAALLKTKSTQIKDSLLISKYRTDYENVIINMEDLCNNMMLNQILKIDVNGDAKSNLENLTILNTLSQARKSLDECMKYVDKQP